MAVNVKAAGPPPSAGDDWYKHTADEVAAAFGVNLANGLPAARAAQLLAANGPNALPEEKPKPGWLRFLDEYRSYMQIILVAAAVVSLLIKEWSTASRRPIVSTSGLTRSKGSVSHAGSTTAEACRAPTTSS